MRCASGDLLLIPEVVARHDVIHDTTSVVMVQSVDNKILEQERENETKRDALKLQKEVLEVEEQAIVVRNQAVEVKFKELKADELELHI